MLNQGRCDYCGLPVFWVKTRNGKAMPLDPLPVLSITRDKKGERTIVTDSGEVVRGNPAAANARAAGADVTTGRISHFATCKCYTPAARAQGRR